MQRIKNNIFVRDVSVKLQFPAYLDYLYLNIFIH